MNTTVASINFTKRFVALTLALTILLGNLLTVHVFAGNLTSRSLALSTSAGNTAATWTFTFNEASSNVLKGIAFQVCDSASGTCNTPGSWSNTGATFSTLTYNGSNQTGWAIDNAGAGGAQFLGIKNNSASNSGANPVIVTFNTVTNPNTTNATFYVRISTFTGNNFTTGADTGVVAASTSQQITLTGTMDESLVFCTGTSITGQNCATVAGSSVGFGTFSSTSTRTGTSVFAASTNGSSGYTVTLNGTTLTCGACGGSPTIAAMGTQTANGAATTSTIGSAQFGVNFRANATPSVGVDKSGSGTAGYGTNYGTVDNFRHFTGDTVASAGGSTNANTFTASYIVNVPGSQQAGTYTTTLTYICTAIF